MSLLLPAAPCQSSPSINSPHAEVKQNQRENGQGNTRGVGQAHENVEKEIQGLEKKAQGAGKNLSG